MTLLIYYTLLYVYGFGPGWYVIGLDVWIGHLMTVKG